MFAVNSNKLIYVADGIKGAKILDVSDPTNIVLFSTYDLSNVELIRLSYDESW
jgi:hypothetical protein